MDELNNNKSPHKNIRLPPLKKVTSANNTPLHSPSLTQTQSPIPPHNFRSAANSPK